MTGQYEVLEKICKNRRSVRSFSEQEVDPGDIDRIKAIAETSPYGSNRKNWELLVVTDREKITKMAEAVREGVKRFEGDVKQNLRCQFASYAQNFSAFESAPVLIIPCFRISPGLSIMLPEPGEDVVQWERDTYVKSISCVAMLVLLAAESLGLAGCYMTGPLLAQEELKEIIHVRRGRDIGAIIPIGYAGGG